MANKKQAEIESFEEFIKTVDLSSRSGGYKKIVPFEFTPREFYDQIYSKISPKQRKQITTITKTVKGYSRSKLESFLKDLAQEADKEEKAEISLHFLDSDKELANYLSSRASELDNLNEERLAMVGSDEEKEVDIRTNNNEEIRNVVLSYLPA